MCFFGAKRLIPSRTHCYTAESFHSRSLAEFISQSGFNILTFSQSNLQFFGSMISIQCNLTIA